MNRKNQDLLYYIASFLIPCALLLTGLAYVDAVPFGDNSILLRDAEIQYIDFVGYLRSIFSGENNFLYSFNKNLGGELVSLLSYYLMSPFNILFAFATNEGLPLVYTIVMVLKLSLCGLTFFHASSRLYGCKGIHLAFSTAYALMAYNVIYGWSIMWLDGVLILPLLALGLYELWGGKAPWRYAASLAYGLLTNFYIGYMLCIASVLFSLVHMLLGEGTFRSKGIAFGKFLGASCIGGFASAFLWLPAFLALLEGRAKFDGNVTGALFNFNILGLAGKLVAGASSSSQLGSGTPHIFCGTLVLLLVMVLFVNKGIAPKIRLTALGVLGILLASFLLTSLNIVWHGFSPNYAFNFRYAFVFNYVMIMLAQYSLSRRQTLDRKWLMLAAGLIAALILALFAIKGVLRLNFLTNAGCLVSLLALAVLAAALLGKRQTGVCTLLILVSVLEMGANCCLSWKPLVNDEARHMLRMSSYNAFHQRLSPAVEYVKETDSGFYRMEKTFLRDFNDPMFFGYNGLSHFSSSQQKQVLRFLEKMGLKNYKNIYSYYNTGSTADADSLLGVKYVLSEKDLTASKGYEHMATVNDIGIYRNPNALPIAMVSEGTVTGVDMENRDYFALHNAIWQGISGVNMPILREAEAYQLRLENLEAFDLGDGNTRYVRIDMEKPASLLFEIPVTREEPLYYYFTSHEDQDANIYVDGVYDGVYFHDTRWDMTNTGVHRVGDTVTIEIELLSGQVAIEKAMFYYEDASALAAHSGAVTERPLTLTQESSSHLTGSFAAQEGQLLLLTVPYDSGWQLYIDGERTEYFQVLDTFLAAQVPEGEHRFELRYVPRGGMAGCCLTVFALVAAGAWCVYDKKRGNRNAKNK